jgi:transcriptional regulator with XRE-family HTH domain
MSGARHDLVNNRVRTLRIERDLTQAELAEASGVAFHIVQRLDANASVRLALDVAIKLASALDVPVEALLPQWSPDPAASA